MKRIVNVFNISLLFMFPFTSVPWLPNFIAWPIQVSAWVCVADLWWIGWIHWISQLFFMACTQNSLTHATDESWVQNYNYCRCLLQVLSLSSSQVLEKGNNIVHHRHVYIFHSGSTCQYRHNRPWLPGLPQYSLDSASQPSEPHRLHCTISTPILWHLRGTMEGKDPWESAEHTRLFSFQQINIYFLGLASKNVFHTSHFMHASLIFLKCFENFTL